MEEVFRKIGSGTDGISEEEAKARLAQYGPNEIVLKKKISKLKILFEQFTNFMVILLIIAAAVLLAMNFFMGESSHLTDAILILAIVIANGIFGFVQDYRAELNIETIKKMSVTHAHIMRDRTKQEIDARDVVPGDVVFLEQGAKVPADVRLIEETDLAADESMLTGESRSVAKKAGQLHEGASLDERTNMLYMNTIVTRGRGKAIVVGTAMSTEMGKIVTQVQTAEERPTPFQEETEKLGRTIGLIILGVIAFVAVILSLAHSYSIIDVIITSIALAVAAIPEGLPAVVTLTLAIGTHKMLGRNALVRRLPAAEGLGSVDVICTDKTGTITEGKMTVEKLYFDGAMADVTGGYSSTGGFQAGGKNVKAEKFAQLLECGAVCNNASGEGKYFGEPTEIALLMSAEKAGLTKKSLDADFTRIKEVPFSSSRKRMTVVISHEGRKKAFMKGAPEVVIERCSRIYDKGKVRAISAADRKKLLETNVELASEALRVLAFACKDVSGSESEEKLESDLVFLGLQGMIDPARPEVAASIKSCQTAGIRVVMITGDNKVTAKAIASKVGLTGDVTEGKTLDSISDEELRKTVEGTNIFARVMPEHKLRILKALQDNGHVVSMTGDGVNDAPALKQADIGVAMGIRGTDVARDVSDMVLLDDNFATIVSAVEQGRTIFANIRKFVNYLLTCNFAEVVVVFLASLAGYLPINAVQLLWINLLTDGFPALALGTDPPAPGIMKEPPRKRGEKVINAHLGAMIFAVGCEMSLFMLATYFISLSYWGHAVATTMVFTAFILYELVQIGIIRLEEALTIFSNKWLLVAMASSVVLQLAVVYTPLNSFFGTVPLGIYHWLFLAFLGAIMWIAAMLTSKIVTRYVR
jgi:Ca2+-transporting ATPase